MKEKVTTEELHKEIELIQACITRMASNSFNLKGWLVSLVSILIVMAPEDTNKAIVLLISLLLTMCFWYLDSFFLRSEKLYRKMYAWTVENRKNDSREFQYDLNPHRFENDVVSIVKIMGSKTLICFYGLVVLAIVAIAIYYKFIV